MTPLSLLEGAVDAVERLDLLDAPGHQLENVLKASFLLARSGSRPLQDLLHGVWLGHPLHPVLVTVPIGSWTTALLLDALAAVGRGPDDDGASARLAVGLGLAGAAASAAAGLTDWQHAHDQARRVGLVHASLNTAGVVLYAVSLADRRRGRQVRGRVLGLAGYAVTTASSYLGGALSYRHRMGMAHGHPGPGPHEYRTVLREDELVDGAPVAAECDGVPVVVVRQDDRVRAVAGTCPHLGAPLAEGWLHPADGTGGLVCPWHGSRFDLDTGMPVQGPSTAPLPCWDARVQDGQVQVRRRAAWRSPTSITTEKQMSR